MSNLKQIEEYLESLSSLGVRQAVNTVSMEDAHRNGHVADLLGEVKRSLKLNCRLILAKVRSGGTIERRAWVVYPPPLPLPQWGTERFQNTRITVYVRRHVLFLSRPHNLIRTLAHECCHIVLDSTQHPLQNEERAVDLCAMLLGYSEVYMRTDLLGESGTVENLIRQVRYWTNVDMVHGAGYLARDEIAHAHRIITKMRKGPTIR